MNFRENYEQTITNIQLQEQLKASLAPFTPQSLSAPCASCACSGAPQRPHRLRR